ncbi:RES family NAD+ phosphorylase [Breoghania sp.]|uniref:RES family NAD+ phosphorylase n=1 Tax=Breoghania sp. TaxID=2065378 RepID=UPI0029C6EAD6|nr:RES family NAD+ phosphorylase [Breoghania sp.]
MITAWRIVSAKRVETAFSGEGARVNGGRWNKKGFAVVYTSSSISLASMELLVNLPAPSLLNQYATIAVRFDEKLMEELDKLPDDWDSRPPSSATKTIGDQWISEKRSTVFKVPSVVVPAEFNYLLNPGHPDWRLVEIGKPEVYRFDPRLARK